MSELLVTAAGLATSIQDLGRRGGARIGVPRAGAVDVDALPHAQRRVGNALTAAGLETCGGLRFRTSGALVLAVCGARLAVTVDGRDVAEDSPVHVPPGSEVALGYPQSGWRAYVAVRGGVQVDPVMGSRSWDSLSRLGPSPPTAGTVLAVGTDPGSAVVVDVAPTVRPDEIVDVTPGPRHDWFSDDARAALSAVEWVVGPDSDRVGLRLTNGELRRRITRELPSEGLVFGAIQVPPSGQPIVMLADHPTTGGYPVIAVVAADHRGAIAQAGPGARLRFRWRGPARRTG